MIHVRAEAARNINSAAEGKNRKCIQETVIKNGLFVDIKK